MGLAHFAAPYRNAGSETVLHLLLKATVEAGHEVRFLATDIPHAPAHSDYDGVHIETVRNIAIGTREMARWRPDVVVSHHQNAVASIRYSKRLRTKSVYLTHNDHPGNALPFKFRPDLVVHNSQWVAESLTEQFGQHDYMLLRPPLDCSRHRSEVERRPSRHGAVTLVNMNQDKGSKMFYELAKRNPNREFLAVKGGHGKQVVERLSNVTHLDNTPNLASVWDQTSVVLMPSIYESYGLVGIEAGCRGIPTIAHPTPGLQESQGAAGIFVDRDDYQAWDKKLNELLGSDEIYHAASVAAAANSRALCEQTDIDMIRWIETLENLV